MPLTDTTVRNAKPESKPRKLADEKGLFLLIHSNGSKYWRFKYRFAGKEKLLALGIYPDVSLAQARQRAFAAVVEIRLTSAFGVRPNVFSATPLVPLHSLV